MQVNNPKANTTPTPKLTVHGLDRVKWYFQCSHRCIGRPMLAKAWLANNIAMQTRKHERYNNEDKHTPSLNVSTEHECKCMTCNLWTYHGVVQYCLQLLRIHILLTVMCKQTKETKTTFIVHVCFLCKIPLMHEWWDCVVRVEEAWSVCEIDLQCIHMSSLGCFKNFSTV